MHPGAPRAAASHCLAWASSTFARRTATSAACTRCSAHLAAATAAVAARFCSSADFKCAVIVTRCNLGALPPVELCTVFLVLDIISMIMQYFWLSGCSWWKGGIANLSWLFLAEGWHRESFLSWIFCLLLVLVLVYIHERSEQFHPLTILPPIPVRGWNFFSVLSRRFGASVSERREFFFSILSQRFGVNVSERMENIFFSILSRRFGANVSERMEFFFGCFVYVD